MITDVLIVGAGAAGMATAIFTRTRHAGRSVVLLDGARKPGAKILVSGGGRCNVTNVVVTEQDYWGGSRASIRRVLRALPVAETVRFFSDMGVALHEEENGKLFPDSNSARQVLEALLSELRAREVDLRAGHRVIDVQRDGDAFRVATTAGDVRARTVVLATGGQSLPKSGSDGAGFAFARALGHHIVPTTPALAPLLLDGDERAVHASLSGVSQNAELSVWSDGRISARLRGSLLWTHFGISGPAALDASRHWLRARLEERTVALTANLTPALDYEEMEQLWLERARTRPRVGIETVVSSLIPAAVAHAVLASLGVPSATPLAELPRDMRRRLSHALTSWPLQVTNSRGYNFAEATAGGVDLAEIDPSTMESRRCPGLYLVGEILDVDGRLGGFNFQWAWSSAAVAAAALARG